MEFSQVAGYISVVLHAFISVLFTETTQVTNKYCDYPLIARYINTVMGTTLFIFPLFSQYICLPKYYLKRNYESVHDENEFNDHDPDDDHDRKSNRSTKTNTNIMITSSNEINYRLNNFTTINHILWHTIGTIFLTGAGMALYLSLEGTTVFTNTVILRARAIWCFIQNYWHCCHVYWCCIVYY